MKQKNTTKIDVLLTAEQKKRISQAAAKDGRSMSSWLRQAAMLRLGKPESPLHTWVVDG